MDSNDEQAFAKAVPGLKQRSRPGPCAKKGRIGAPVWRSRGGAVRWRALPWCLRVKER